MFLLIDKPKGITSHDVVNRLRRITGEKRIGHAGTLDPNASGLLVVAVGRQSTKKLSEVAKNTKKTYIANIHLGEVRDTDDVEGIVIKSVDLKDFKTSQGQLDEVLKSFLGEQKQVPPIYSAIKIKGKPAYSLARKGKTPVLEPRKVFIYSIKLLDFKRDSLIVEFEVSSGTYIRSLARDIGEKIGSGAYLEELRRTKIGDFSLENSISLDKLNESNWESFGIQL